MKNWICLLLTSFCLFPFSGKAANPSDAEKLLSVNRKDYAWIDGNTQFQAIRDDKGLRMYGMTLHEGGLGFALKAASDGNKWTIGPVDAAVLPDGYASLEYMKLDKDGKPYLIVRNRAGKLVNILRGGEDLRKAAVAGICSWLEGTYADEKGRRIVFEANPQTVSGFPGATRYTVESSFDIPDKVITLSSGKSYSLETESVSAAGAPRLRLERVKHTEMDTWDSTEEETLFLTKTGWHEGRGEKSGRYSFTDAVVLPGWLMLYTTEELGFIRNEIFARHGYIFQDPKYKTHFEAQPWYRPVSRNMEGKLTPEERLNLETIGAILEERKRQEN